LGARALRRDDFAAVDVGIPTIGGNVVTLLAPLAIENADQVADALDDFYTFGSEGSTGTVYLFSAWPTPDLRPHGWTLTEYMPLMLRPSGGVVPATPPGLRLDTVRDERGLRDFESAIVRGFGDHDLEALGPGTAFSPGILADDRMRMWVGWEGARPVCAAATFVAEGINQVTLVATVPEARRRGYGAAVTWCATLADPTLPSLLIATEEGRHVYERIGYVSLLRFTLWSRERPGDGTTGSAGC